MRDLAARDSVPDTVFPVDSSKPIAFAIRHQQLADVVVTKVRAGNYAAVRGEGLVRHSEPRVILQVPKHPVATEQRGHQVRSGTGSVGSTRRSPKPSPDRRRSSPACCWPPHPETTPRHDGRSMRRSARASCTARYGRRTDDEGPGGCVRTQHPGPSSMTAARGDGGNRTPVHRWDIAASPGAVCECVLLGPDLCHRHLSRRAQPGKSPA